MHTHILKKIGNKWDKNEMKTKQVLSNNFNISNLIQKKPDKQQLYPKLRKQS